MSGGLSVSGVIISWVFVSERMSLNSGVGGLGASSVSSSRLWRILRSEGITSRIAIDKYRMRIGLKVNMRP